MKACVENTARYPRHFLAYAPGSDDRDGEYEALNHADPDRLPDTDPTKHTAAYQPAVIDKPVTDAMEKGGQDQRLLLALLIAVGELGALLLLGSLAVSVRLGAGDRASPGVLLTGRAGRSDHPRARPPARSTRGRGCWPLPGAQGRLLARARRRARRSLRAAGRHHQPRVADVLRPPSAAAVDRLPPTPRPRRATHQRAHRPPTTTRRPTATPARPQRRPAHNRPRATPPPDTSPRYPARGCRRDVRFGRCCRDRARRSRARSAERTRRSAAAAVPAINRDREPRRRERTPDERPHETGDHQPAGRRRVPETAARRRTPRRDQARGAGGPRPAARSGRQHAGPRHRHATSTAGGVTRTPPCAGSATVGGRRVDAGVIEAPSS